MNLGELKYEIKKGTPLKWCDPQPIKNNDYTINLIVMQEHLKTKEFDEEEDLILLIQYGEGSEAEVYLDEIEII